MKVTSRLLPWNSKRAIAQAAMPRPFSGTEIAATVSVSRIAAMASSWVSGSR